MYHASFLSCQGFFKSFWQSAAFKPGGYISSRQLSSRGDNHGADLTAPAFGSFHSLESYAWRGYITFQPQPNIHLKSIHSMEKSSPTVILPPRRQAPRRAAMAGGGCEEGVARRVVVMTTWSLPRSVPSEIQQRVGSLARKLRPQTEFQGAYLDSSSLRGPRGLEPLAAYQDPMPTSHAQASAYGPSLRHGGG